MSQEPLRRRPQFHLSTAVVLMFTTGGLMWANLTPEKTELRYSPAFSIVETRLGWPMVYAWKSSTQQLGPSGVLRSAPGWEYLGWSGLLDAAVALFIVHYAGRFCEWLIRRKTSQKNG